MKNVIYAYFDNDERTFFIDYLCEKYDWQPVFFLASENMRAWAEKKYPKAVRHDSTAIRKAHFDYSRIGPEIPIDKEILDNLTKYSGNFLNWMEDTTGWNFSFNERRQFYYDLLKFWNTVIGNIKPDLFVAYTWPHVHSDYPLYLLCKYHYKIPVLILDAVPYLDGNSRMVSHSMEDSSSMFKSAYLSDKKVELSPAVEAYLAVQRSNKPETQKHIIYYYQRLDEMEKKQWLERWMLLKLFLRGSLFKETNLAFKKNTMPLESSKSQMNHLDYYLFKRTLARKTRNLKKLYDDLSRPTDATDKYIYFAAPYQPEVTSNLWAGVYENLFLIMDIVSAAIPEDWVIYYKEHPNSFKVMDKGALARNKYFYRKVNAYPKVKIVPIETSTFSLLDASQAVCTVGGTVAWEAIVRGKPALSFGKMWYQSCKSIFTIETLEDAVNAVNKIIEGFTPEEEDVNRFAQAIYDVSEQDLIFPSKTDNKIKVCADPKSEMIRLAEVFHSTYVKCYGTSTAPGPLE
jgi:hypothetical protein